MKQIILYVFLIISSSLHAQRERAEAYINKYKDLAISEMQRTGIPASITLAQGILESQFGESDLAVNANNHFGIKCKTEWTGQKTYHDDDLKKECFRVYPSAADSYKDHSNFLMTREWYAFLFKLEPTDDSGWAYGLKKAGYATEKDYPQRLLKLINDYQLQQYSLAALGKPFTETTSSNIVSNKNLKKQRIINQPSSQTNSAAPVAEMEPVIVKKSIEATDPEEKNEAEIEVKKQVNNETEIKKISALCDSFGVLMAPHNPLGPIATMVNVHIGLSTSNFLIQEVMRNDVPWREDVFEGIAEIREGYVYPPTEPGIGISLNEDLAKHYPFQNSQPVQWFNKDGSVADW